MHGSICAMFQPTSIYTHGPTQRTDRMGQSGYSRWAHAYYTHRPIYAISQPTSIYTHGPTQRMDRMGQSGYSRWAHVYYTRWPTYAISQPTSIYTDGPIVCIFIGPSMLSSQPIVQHAQAHHIHLYHALIYINTFTNLPFIIYLF
jgi:hypothetical protein